MTAADKTPKNPMDDFGAEAGVEGGLVWKLPVDDFDAAGDDAPLDDGGVLALLEAELPLPAFAEV